MQVAQEPNSDDSLHYVCHKILISMDINCIMSYDCFAHTVTLYFFFIQGYPSGEVLWQFHKEKGQNLRVILNLTKVITTPLMSSFGPEFLPFRGSHFNDHFILFRTSYSYKCYMKLQEVVVVV